MFSERMLSGVVALAVVFLTVGFFVIAEPEEKRVTSHDAVVTVTGLARQTQPFTIDPVASEVGKPLQGKAYKIMPDEVTLDEPAVVLFALPLDVEAERLGVFRYRSDLLMWEKVEPVVAHATDVLAVQTGRLGTFAIGQVEHFTAPAFVTTYETLRAMAPDNAVGYETVVGYRRSGEETIRLYDLGESGGCGGAVRVGDGEQTSQLQREILLTINDAPTTVEFVFLTRWFTSSAGGCTENEPLEPLSEYDILQPT